MTGLWVLLTASLVLAAFAAAAETALTSVSRLRMRSMAADGDRRAIRVVQLHNDPNAYLSTILSVNTVAVIVASTVSALIILERYQQIPEVVGTIALSVVVLVFCEIAPKSLALRFNERLALPLAAPVQLLTKTLRPLVGGLTLFTTLLLRIATRGGGVRGPYVTEEELKLLLFMGEQEGVVEQEERQMIHGILEMTDKSVREIVVPRVDVIGIDADDSIADLINLVIEYGHSRIPIYEGSIDNVVGVIYAKDLLRQGIRSDDTRPLRAIAREPYYTVESKHVGELLHEMQEKKVHIAIVLDEHGGTGGIVTFEDLIEEIVGPIRDEYDAAEQEDVQFLSDTEVLMNARFPLDDVRELLHLDMGKSESDSIGGFVYERLGDIPKAGATIRVGGVTITVDAMRRQSIKAVRIASPTPFLTERDGRNGAGSGEPGSMGHGG
ncbi:MAG: hemolysin family protein [Candidatus Dormibacteria bacterium]